jgi:hypothetical protein
VTHFHRCKRIQRERFGVDEMEKAGSAARPGSPKSNGNFTETRYHNAGKAHASRRVEEQRTYDKAHLLLPREWLSPHRSRLSLGPGLGYNAFKPDVPIILPHLVNHGLAH